MNEAVVTDGHRRRMCDPRAPRPRRACGCSLTLFAVRRVPARALGFAGVMGLYAYYARDLPDPGALSHRQLFQTARIFDRHGTLLQELNDPSGGRRILVTLADIPQVMREATIAAEDASFYDNPGFDSARSFAPPTSGSAAARPRAAPRRSPSSSSRTPCSVPSKPPNARSKKPSWPWS